MTVYDPYKNGVNDQALFKGHGGGIEIDLRNRECCVSSCSEPRTSNQNLI